MKLKKRVIIELGLITYEEMPGRYKYRLVEPYTFRTGIKFPRAIKHHMFKVSRAGTVDVNPGFCWDGVTSGPDVDSALRASLEHDIMTQLYRLYKLCNEHIKRINDNFARTCKMDGMSAALRWAMRGTLRAYWLLTRRKEE